MSEYSIEVEYEATPNDEGLPTEQATVTCGEEPIGDQVKIVAYWHTPSDGRPAYIVVDVDTVGNRAQHDAEGVPNRLKITVNDGTVYSHPDIEAE